MITRKKKHPIFYLVPLPPTGHKRQPYHPSSIILLGLGPSYHASLPRVPKMRVWKRKRHPFFLQKWLSHFLINKQESSFNAGVLFPEIVYNGFREGWAVGGGGERVLKFAKCPPSP